MEELLKNWEKKKENAAISNRNKAIELKKLPDLVLDEQMKMVHQQAFEQVDCLKCGNCCKVLKPYFEQEDIERIAGHFDLSPADFSMKYLEVNNYKQFRMATKPCSFLNEDNSCQIYDIRPLNCRQYPHTNRSNAKEHIDMVADHTEVCPAVFLMFEILGGI